MKRKFVNGIIVVLFIIIIFSTVTYFSSQKDIAKWEADTVQMAKKEAQMDKVTQFYVFTKDKTYYTVQGEDESGSEIYFTYSPDTKEKRIGVVSEMVNKENAIALTRNDLPDVTVENANIGVENDGYVWEVSFRDSNGALGYHYIDASDAQWYETINNL